jgi:hypothetical protein
MMKTYWLEGIKKEGMSSVESSKLQYYSHLRYDPEQDIEEKESSEEESAPDLCEKVKNTEIFDKPRLPSADLFQLSVQTPSLQLFDSETEDID